MAPPKTSKTALCLCYTSPSLTSTTLTPSNSPYLSLFEVWNRRQKSLESVTEVPEPVSPRYRSRVPKCHIPTGANVESMYRDRTQIETTFRGQTVGKREFGSLLIKSKAPLSTGLFNVT